MASPPGNTLKLHQEWLVEHSQVDKNGRIVCRFTKEPLNSKPNHRYRMNSAPVGSPFITEDKLEGTGGGGIITFMSFSCPRCNSGPDVPDSVYKEDLVFRRAKE